MPPFRIPPILRYPFSLATTLILLPTATWALGDTDTVTWGGDNTRAGYQTCVAPVQINPLPLFLHPYSPFPYTQKPQHGP